MLVNIQDLRAENKGFSSEVLDNIIQDIRYRFTYCLANNVICYISALINYVIIVT